jgi:3-hydroxyisobutyrate dehydrogenase-like beta-hydroxyacid dehydrogenase
VAAVVGVVGTGEMGSAVGAAFRAGGARVVTSLSGRSDRSGRLARAAGLELLGSLDDVVDQAQTVLSVVPPAASRDVAREVAAAATRTRAGPLVADLNAVSPATVAEIGEVLGAAGLDFVDGSISGPPPRPSGRTTLYVSGARAAEIAAFDTPGLVTRIVGVEPGLASAVKMCTASANVVVARAAAKAGRYVGEMREIEATQAKAGLPTGLFAGMSEVCEALAARAPSGAPELVTGDVPLEDVLDSLDAREA